MKQTKQKGFTLVEMLLVVAVLGLIIGISFPQLRTRYQHDALDQQIKKAARMIRYGQYRAIADSKPISVHVNAADSSYQLMHLVEKNGGWEEQTLEGEWGRAVDLKAPLEILDDSKGPVFLPDGTTEGGELLFKNQDAKTKLLIKPGLGRVEIDHEK